MTSVRRTITPEMFAQTIDDLLREYGQDVIKAVNDETDAAAKHMVKLTKQQTYKNGGKKFRNAIAWKRERTTTEGTVVDRWYVKSPHYRLTHLLEHGHATVNGGRTVAYGFVGRARDATEVVYLRNLRERLEHAS